MRIYQFLIMALCALTLAPLSVRAQIFTQPEPIADTRVQQLKQQILQIALTNEGKTANVAKVRKTLDPFIAELVSLVPNRTEPEKLAQVVGAWQQVWTDGVEIFEGPPPGKFDFSDIFQIVFPSGYYYNIGRYQRSGIDWTVFLRGSFIAQPESLNVTFTKYVYGSGWLFTGSDLIYQALRAEAGVFDKQPFNPPNNPIGLPQLALSNIYVDNDFRLLQAGSGPMSSLFVLVRVGSRP